MFLGSVTGALASFAASAILVVFLCLGRPPDLGTTAVALYLTAILVLSVTCVSQGLQLFTRHSVLENWTASLNERRRFLDRRERELDTRERALTHWEQVIPPGSGRPR